MPLLLVLHGLFGAGSAGHPPAPPPLPVPVMFNQSFGSYMVLQSAPAAAAAYGEASRGKVGSQSGRTRGGPQAVALPCRTLISLRWRGCLLYCVAVGTAPAEATAVKITVSGGASGSAYSSMATLADGLWKALLKPEPAGGDYTITASCTGCVNTTTAVLEHVTFGDVWYCAGQVRRWSTAR